MSMNGRLYACLLRGDFNRIFPISSESFRGVTMQVGVFPELRLSVDFFYNGQLLHMRAKSSLFVLHVVLLPWRTILFPYKKKDFLCYMRLGFTISRFLIEE